ncbi:MAG: hypothetical protein CK521_07415 [Acidimicrobium sp.]|jgi:hypothetical protein|nr:MAG: hypothetical protein CK521_07415 [Acidimicrobium sp.]
MALQKNQQSKKEKKVNTNTPSSSRKLTLDDIADLRAYERERPDFRAHVIEVKRRRRLAIGEMLTIMFENRDTMRLQIQEMIRAEKLVTDEGVMEELKVYNPMIPMPGQLCATLFLELTSEDQVREWLPKLAGLEDSICIQLSDGSKVRGSIDAQHAAGLTRPDVTAAVHYLTFEFTEKQIEQFAFGPVSVLCDQPNYLEVAPFSDETRDELLTDLRP